MNWAAFSAASGKIAPARRFGWLATMPTGRSSTRAKTVIISRRALLEAKIHAANRETFDEPLQDHALVQADLVDMSIDYEGRAALLYDAAATVEGCGATRTPTTCASAVSCCRSRSPHCPPNRRDSSYTMEILGGNGTVSDFVTERLYRDAQIHPI